MSFEFLKKLPTPTEIKAAYPLSEEFAKIKRERDEEIAKIFKGESNKFIVIIGPCSADNEEAVLDYTTRLAKIQDKIKDKILIIPRVYTNKPRTTGIGYKGMLHQPNPEEKSDLYGGLVAIRKMHIDIIKETGLTPADEMLYPENYWYLEDVLSYVAVGARSVENQEHRLVSSGIDVPVGMKNPTSGDFSVMLNSVVAAQSKQTFIYRTNEVTTNGNALTHCILRGAVNKHGQNNPNYHYEDIVRLYNMYKARELQNPAVIIDANHSNSGKQYKEQVRICKEVLHNCKYNPNIRELVKGVMIESYIEEGAQKVGEGIYGKSITDACLGWNQSEELLYEIADRLI
ncbi:3-deoxy-7-phosphoheptulonate synthase [Lachnospira multipara]|uniref:3-deoxy-7-phosphoheptulonate synthase n=1 Tax=Lachnospira multipara TaxID=28051 RepID=UPI0004870466|nr:3-deoxy-7-phosphoheptulonate synthase [Lachnospira multipara]